jgi:hypothetical protein
MSFTDSLFKFIGSRWFTFFLGLALIAALPFTWHNFTVIQQAGQLAKFWYLIAVFVINVLSVLLCAYKFMSSFGKKQPTIENKEW